MKQIISTPEREFDIALAYYKRTVWNHVPHLPLTGAQFHVALRAWERLDTTQRTWSDSLELNQKAKAAKVDIRALRPRSVEHNNNITPETLTNVAMARLGARKPESVPLAFEDAHRNLMAARDYLKSLPEPKTKLRQKLEAYNAHVSFAEILASSEKPKCFPLLRTVQKDRNGGKLTSRALAQAVKRHPDKRKKIQKEICEALKNKEISCRLLEEIRWQRFRLHFKG